MNFQPPSPYQPYGGAPFQPKQGTPGKATASLVLGIAGLIICPLICSVLAIIFGTQAKNEIRRQNLGGYGIAQAGFILGIIGLILGILGAILWIAVLSSNT